MPEKSLPLVTEQPVDKPQRRAPRGTALCLSGGGYRAMLFHLGALIYLNERGWLKKIDRISSVSGGSITAAALGMKFDELTFDPSGVATNFMELVVTPIRKLAAVTIDKGAIIGGILTPDSIGERLIETYRRHLFGKATLQDLPDKPHFVINATNVQSGVLFRFSKAFIWDYRVGKIEKPNRLLAEAVAASSAFPPVLSPVRLDLRKERFTPGSGQDLQRSPYTTEVVLTDGGVYDNMGIETAWKSFSRILVSDAGGKMQPEKYPKADWAQHALRINGIIDNQVRSLRKRQLIYSFRKKEKEGTYWGIRSDITHYRLTDALPCPHERTMDLAETPTRLEEMKPALQERLMNWGYAVCDAAMRRHVDSTLAKPAGFPFARGI